MKSKTASLNQFLQEGLSLLKQFYQDAKYNADTLTDERIEKVVKYCRELFSCIQPNHSNLSGPDKKILTGIVDYYNDSVFAIDLAIKREVAINHNNSRAVKAYAKMSASK